MSDYDELFGSNESKLGFQRRVDRDAKNYCVKCDRNHSSKIGCNEFMNIKEFDRLLIKNEFTKNGEKRVNTLKLKRFESGDIMVYIIGGHSRATKEKYEVMMILNKKNIEIVKAFLNEKT